MESLLTTSLWHYVSLFILSWVCMMHILRMSVITIIHIYYNLHYSDVPTFKCFSFNIRQITEICSDIAQCLFSYIRTNSNGVSLQLQQTIIIELNKKSQVRSFVQKTKTMTCLSFFIDDSCFFSFRLSGKAPYWTSHFTVVENTHNYIIRESFCCYKLRWY